MTHDKLTKKRWRRELKRRALRALRRRLMAQCGTTLGQTFYDQSRVASRRRGLVRQFKQRPQPAVKTSVPKMVEAPQQKPSFFRRLFGA